MKKYRLLRDMPGAKAGTEFYGGHEALKRVGGHTYPAVDVQLAGDPEWFEEIPEMPYPEPRKIGYTGRSRRAGAEVVHVTVWGTDEHAIAAQRIYELLAIVLRHAFNRAALRAAGTQREFWHAHSAGISACHKVCASDGPHWHSRQAAEDYRDLVQEIAEIGK